MSFPVTTPDGTVLAGEEAGEGTPVVCLHGLTATRRYVVHGSRSLERSGHRVLLYDARGHGASGPAPASAAYTYPDLVTDLAAVLDEHAIDRAVLAGASMGAHTLLRFALEHSDRVAALCVITPAYEPERFGDERGEAKWDRLAEGLRSGGVEGFLEAYRVEDYPERWRETLERVVRQRFAEHERREAVADALQAVPRSRPFERIEDLGAITVPTAVVASRDEPDPGHPHRVGVAYAEAIPGARLHTEEEGKSPIAWQGGALSRVIAELASGVTA